MNIQKVISDFVVFAQGLNCHRPLNGDPKISFPQGLGFAEEQLIKLLLEIAGFLPTKIEFGNSVKSVEVCRTNCQYEDIDYGPTCKICVWDSTSYYGRFCPVPTRWLDSAFLTAINHDASTAIQKLEEEIRGKTNPPMIIRLTEFGDEVKIDGLIQIKSLKGFGNWANPNSQLPKTNHTIGIHEECSGFIAIENRSKTHHALVCRGNCCAVFQPFPKEITTFRELLLYYERVVEGVI